MDKWQNQFDKLKRQWSEFNRINSDYGPHDKRQVAKVGVAWVVKLPEEYFKKPVGWEVEIIDTPLGISERSNKLLKWLRHPPTSVYDNISLFNDSSETMLNDSFGKREHIGYKRKNEHSFSFHEPEQKFEIPLNEYEIFKKSCCECKEKSFKNTATDYESDIKSSTPKQQNVAYSLHAKSSHLDLPPTITVNQSLYSDFEQELNTQMLDQSSIDRSQESKQSKKYSNTRDNRSNAPKTTEQSLRSEQQLLNNRRTNGNYPIHYGQNNHSISSPSTTVDINNETVPLSSSPPRRRSTGPHIPSVDAFDDNILTRGASLEQYRNTDHIFHPSKDDDLTFKRQGSNGHRNHHHRHHRHRHRTNGSKDVSIETVTDNNIFPENEPIELREEFDEKEENMF